MYTTAVTAGAQVAIAIGTFAAVFVALFGNWLRGQIAPPRLKLTLENEKGQKQKTFVVSPSGEKRDTLLRSYQVRVENERRWSPAQEVQVYLLSVEEPDVTGTNKPNWVGEIPIQWQNQKIHPLTRTIGHAANCELCSVVKEKWIELHPLINPVALDARRREPCHMTLTLQARGLLTDSNLLRVEIAYDGKWSDDTDEMARHTVVKAV